MTTNGAPVEQPAEPVSDVLVIGAGQAGLAIGRQLQQHGRTFLIVDAGGEVGHVRRSRWDSLTLFTAARYSGLPGPAFPGEPDSYPTKDAAAQYLRHHVRLPIRHNTRVTRVSRDGAGFKVHTDGPTFRAARVVVATGPFQNPVIPAVAEEIGPHIPSPGPSTPPAHRSTGGASVRSRPVLPRTPLAAHPGIGSAGLRRRGRRTHRRAHHARARRRTGCLNCRLRRSR